MPFPTRPISGRSAHIRENLSGGTAALTRDVRTPVTSRLPPECGAVETGLVPDPTSPLPLEPTADRIAPCRFEPTVLPCLADAGDAIDVEPNHGENTYASTGLSTAPPRDIHPDYQVLRADAKPGATDVCITHRLVKTIARAGGPVRAIECSTDSRLRNVRRTHHLRLGPPPAPAGSSESAMACLRLSLMRP